MMSIKSMKIPGVGMRNVKTALAAAFCAFIYYFFDRSPAFACIGAIFGMGSDMEDSRKNGGNRLFRLSKLTTPFLKTKLVTIT